MKAILFTAALFLLSQPLLQRLHAQTVDVSHILTGHLGTVHHVSFDAAGTRLITAGQDSTARIWNTADGTELQRLRSSSGPVLYAFLSNDGREAVTFSPTEVVRWDAETGAPKGQPTKFSVVSAKRMEKGEGIIAATYDGVHIFTFFSSHYSSYTFDGESGINGPKVLDVAISGDHSLPLAARFIYYREPGFPPQAPPSYGIELVQFNPAIATPVKRDTLGGLSPDASVNFRPGSSSELGVVFYSASSVLGGTVTRNDWRNVLSFAHPQVRSVSFSATGDRVVTLGGGVARIWKSPAELLDSLTGGVTDVAFSTMDKWMAVSREDGTVALTGTIDTTTAPHDLQVSLGRIDFGEVAVGSGRDTVVPLLLRNTRDDVRLTVDLATEGNRSFRIMFDTLPDSRVTIEPSQALTVGLRFNPLDSGLKSGALVITTHRSGDILPQQKIHLTGVGRERTYFQHPADSVVTLGANELITSFVLFGVNDSAAVTEAFYRVGNMAVRVWDVGTGRELLNLEERLIGVLPGGERMVTQEHTTNAPVRVRDIRSGAVLAEIRSNGSSASGGVLSNDGKRMVIAEPMDRGKVWDLETGAELAVFDAKNKNLQIARFSPDNAYIVAAGYDGALDIWDIAGKTTFRFEQGDTSASLFALFTPDGKHVVTGSSNHNTILFWDVRSGKIVSTLNGHTDRAIPVRFSPDGSRLLTAGNDGTAKVWNLATGTELFTLNGHGSPLRFAAYSPDGDRIVTQGAEDAEFYVWSGLTGERLKSVPYPAPSKKSGTSIFNFNPYGLNFSSDGSRLGIASRTGDAAIFGPSVALPYIVPGVDSVDFASTSVGSVGEVEIEFLNRGPVPLQLRPRIFPATDGFTLPDGDNSFTLLPDQRQTIRVRYAPGRTEGKDDSAPLAAAEVAAYLTLQYGQSGAIAHVRLQGRASGTVGVDGENVAVLRSSALQIAPNPVGEHARISFVMRSAGVCRLSLVNERGEAVREVLNNRLNAGGHSVEFDSGDLPGGEYFVLLQMEEGQDVRPLRLVR